MRQDHQRSTERLQQHFNNTVEQLRQDHQRSTENMRQDHQRSTEQLQQRFNKTVGQLRQDNQCTTEQLQSLNNNSMTILAMLIRKYFLNYYPQSNTNIIYHTLFASYNTSYFSIYSA